MKRVIIIADGAADKPLPELGGRTPLEAARTPNLDALAASGRLGTAVTTPPGFEAGSDVCSMCLLGYDPATFHTGRAPLEAAALGLRLAPSDWIFRLNLITIGEEGSPDAGLILDHSAGAISNYEARDLVVALVEHWRSVLPELARDFSLTPGVSYRNILIDHRASEPGAGLDGRDYASVRTTPPHEVPRRPWALHLPRVDGSDPAGSRGAAALLELMEAARQFLPGHPVNQHRHSAGGRPANAAWIWGQGRRPRMPAFAERFNPVSAGRPVRGAMITAVDLLAGIAALIGWDRVECPGITSYHDTDYAMQGRVTCGAIDRYDVVCSHVESPDEASHQGDWKTKVSAIEAMDQHVVGPVVAHLREHHGRDWRVLLMPDHFTLVSTRKHDPTPPPWLIAGSDVRAHAPGVRFTESCASGPGTRRVDPGDGLMRLLLDGEP